jgi:hypothetical protein
MAQAPSFISTPRLAVTSASAANTAIDGTGSINSLISGVDAGTRILEIDVQMRATSSAALVNIFITTDNATTWRLFDQITITAATSSNTVKANRNLATYTNLILPSASAQLGWTTTIGQWTNVIALGGDLT